MPHLQSLRKAKDRSKKTVSKMTYKDINELSKKVLLEDLQRKWINRERPRPEFCINKPAHQSIGVQGISYSDTSVTVKNKAYFKKLGMKYNYGEGKKLNMNIETIYKRMALKNNTSRARSVMSKRPTQSSKGIRSKGTSFDRKPSIPKRGNATSRYNPEYSPERLSKINNGENFTDVLKETIIKDIKSDVFREMAQVEGGIPKSVRNSYLPSSFGSIQKLNPITRKINDKIDHHIQKHHLILEK
mmetsp:Transcript_5440/g.4610  ORF Transcript_5440/g.4610 Transcript_5440/m.4610 type:complete len:244 (+) Transcript_5440:424-1155(+)